MARQPKNQDALPEVQMTTEDLGAAPEEQSVPLIEEAPVVADASTKNQPGQDAVALGVPSPEYYRVTRGGSVLTEHGYRVTIKEGKVIDTLNYDLERLRRQGVQLVRISDEERLGTVR